MLNKVREAVDFLRSQLGDPSRTAIVLGSGLGGFVDAMTNCASLNYSCIPNWPISTAPGHAGSLVKGELGGKTIVVMQGRVHYYEGYGPDQVVFPIRVLGEWGISNLLLTNASGGISHSLKPGDLVLIHDHINLTGFNPLVGKNIDKWGPRFPDMTYAYSEELMSLMEKAAINQGILTKRGVYVAFSGPSYETPAEIRMARLLGADLVGMSTVPEVITANHMGIRVAAISCVANYAAGMTSKRLTEGEVLSEMAKASGKLIALITAIFNTSDVV